MQKAQQNKTNRKKKAVKVPTPPRATILHTLTRAGQPKLRQSGNWEKAFLAMFRETGNVTIAARFAKIERSTAYARYKASPEFKEKWDDAYQESSDLLEAEARRRAMEGVPRPIYQQGALVGFEQVYSDNLLLAKLKAKRPNEYKDRVETQHTGKDGGELTLKIKSLADEQASFLNSLTRNGYTITQPAQ